MIQLDVALDQHRHQNRATAAEQLGRDEEAQADHEHQDRTGHDPRRGHGQEYPAEGVERLGAETFRGLQQVLRDLFHHRVQRQDHERQHDVQGTDHGAGGVVHQVQRLIDDAQIHERLVDQAASLQQHQPGIGTHQHAGPERDNHADQNQIGPEAMQPGGGVGDGEAQHNGENGHHEADLERQAEGVPVNAFLKDPRIVGEREAFLGLH